MFKSEIDQICGFCLKTLGVLWKIYEEILKKSILDLKIQKYEMWDEI